MTLILAKKSIENEDSILNKCKQASNPTGKKNICTENRIMQKKIGDGTANKQYH